MAKAADWEPCGLGVCAAEDGHKGTCAEASGWNDPEPTMEDILRAIPDPGDKITVQGTVITMIGRYNYEGEPK